MNFEKLTGKTRHRKSIFGKLILQVEITYYDDMPHGGIDRTTWRDATVSDITAQAAKRQEGE